MGQFKEKFGSRIEELEAQLASLKTDAAAHSQAEEAAAAEAAAAATNGNVRTVQDTPEIRAAAKALAEAVARAEGINLQLGIAEGAQVPLIEIPVEVLGNSAPGGIGIAVVLARPGENATR